MTKDIFLMDGSITTWDRPVREGYMRMPAFLGESTELLGFIGLDEISEDVGRYKVVASSAKYLTNIVRGSFENAHSETRANPKKQILFSGGIQIYEKGTIPGTDIEGYDLVRTGKIWVAKNPLKKYEGEHGLNNLIFDPKKDSSTIERIANGYQTQSDKRQKAESDSRHRSFLSGREAGEKSFPQFRSGPC